MDLVFKKYFWVLNGLLLVGMSFLGARLATSYVENEVLAVPWAEEGEMSLPDAESGHDFRAVDRARRIGRNRRQEIMERTGTTPKQPEIKAEEPIKEEKLEEPEEKPEETPAASMDLEFLAAVTTGSPDKAVAFVKVDGAEGRWVGMGAELKSGILVAEITRDMLRATDGTVKYLWEKPEPKEDKLPNPLVAGARPRSLPKPSERKRHVTKPVKRSKANEMEGIAKVGDWEYKIDRGVLDEQLQDLGKLGRQARVIPNYDRDSGSYKGFKLIGVRPNSLYRAIGIRSGDVILQVNGEQLNSPSKALELFTKLQTSSKISLDIKRRGKTETLLYKIQ